MIEIIESKFLGFCSGVERAYKVVKNLLEENNKVYINKELVHNKEVINELKKKGLIFVDDIDKIPNESIFIIPAHGLSSDELKKVKEKRLKVFDVTCPLVIKSKKIGEKILKRGDYLIIIGEKNHQEIIFLYSNLKSEKTLILDENDEIPEINGNVGVIIQTTKSVEFYEKMKDKIKSKIKNVTFFDTICSESKKRQEEVIDLAKKVDFLIVVGGKNSSNTKRLFEIAKKYVTSIHIENENELDEDYLKNVKKIGIVSGTSTPKKIIERVKEKCLKLQ
ncbi:MAG: 4-hydroxy-3-methylbut-2-enyl diphosphate reductase [Caldisericia bacterium]|nr:4-hydroxy-3-methylbut-2-enyl diphosphate reductase [Caldisericia bacterium]